MPMARQNRAILGNHHIAVHAMPGQALCQVLQLVRRVLAVVAWVRRETRNVHHLHGVHRHRTHTLWLTRFGHTRLSRDTPLYRENP
jgi:hypothetical protein